MGIALAFVGSLINIPVVVTTLALDSMPGYSYALLFGGPGEAVVAALGHLVTAWLRGFPYSIPVHVGVMAGMGLAAWLLGFVTSTFKLWVGAIVAVIVNGVLLPATLIPLLGVPFFVASVLPLTVVSAVNVILAVALAQILRHVIARD
jgi:hypothetical protein